MPIDITNQVRRARYAISGTGPYGFDFEVLAETDVAVYRDATLLTLTTDYTVELNEDGTGEVTLVADTGTTLTIVGARPYARITDYSTGGDFKAATINNELDSFQIQVLQLDERIRRTFAVGISEETPGPMPTSDERANMYLAFDADGDPIASTGTGTDSGLRTDLASGSSTSLGDTLIAVKKTGASAATTLHAINEDREWNFKLDFEGVGDDSTNNDTAITAMLAAVSSGDTVYVPNGIYRFATGFTWPVGVNLRGESRSDTKLRYTGNGVGITTEDTFGSDPFHNRTTFKSFWLTTTTTAPSTGPGTHGIRLANAAYVDLDDVEITNFSTAGLHFASTADKAVLYISVKRCHIRDNENGILATGVNAATNAICIDSSSIRANHAWNIYSELDVRAWSIEGGSLEGGGDGGLFLRSALGLSIKGVYFECAGVPAVQVADTGSDGAGGISITGCEIQGNASGTAIILGDDTTPTPARGVDVSGNIINGWATGVDPQCVFGGVIGPNDYRNTTTAVAVPGAACTGLLVVQDFGSQLYGGALEQFKWTGSWDGGAALRYETVPFGPVAYSSYGTNTTPVANRQYWAEVHIERSKTLTGVGLLNGATVGTDKTVVGLYDAAGTLVRQSAAAGVTTSGANTPQEIAFTTAYAAVPGRYFISVQRNGANDTFRTIAANTYARRTKQEDGASFGDMADTFTPPTTFTADIGPIAYVF